MRVIRRPEVFGISNWVGPFPEMGSSGEEQGEKTVTGVRNHLLGKKIDIENGKNRSESILIEQ